ncbi:uncharacterized protein B4U79_02544, partial [Dinothrombium tinctorium]
MSVEESSIFALIRNCDVRYLEQKIRCGNYDLNAVDTRGNSPILYAANDGNLFLIELLINLGAEFIHERRPEKVHCDPLHIAAKRGHFEVIKFLVRKGANVNAGDSVGRTPLFYALVGGHRDVCSILLQSGESSSLNCFEPSYIVPVDTIPITLTSECIPSEKRSLTVSVRGEILKYILWQKHIECRYPSISNNLIATFRCFLSDEIKTIETNDQENKTMTYAFTMRKSENAYELINHGARVQERSSEKFRFSSGVLRPLQSLLDSNFLVDVSYYLEEDNPFYLNNHDERIDGQIELTCYKHYWDEGQKAEKVDQYEKWFLEVYEWLKNKLTPPLSLLHSSAAALRP